MVALTVRSLLIRILSEKERLAQKEAERKEHAERSRSSTPASKKRSKSSSTQAPKKASESPLPLITPKPGSKVSLRKKVLQKQAAGNELDSPMMSSDEQSMIRIPAAIPEKLLKAADALGHELNRGHRDGIVNPAVVDEIQDREISIGNELLNALGGKTSHQAEVILENAGHIDEDLKDICLNLDALNKTTAKPVVAAETIKRLNEIRMSIGGLANNVIATAQPAADNVELKAKHIVNLMDASIEEASIAIDNLSKVQPITSDEGKVVSDLIANNSLLIVEVETQKELLIEAITNEDPNLAIIVQETAADLNQSIHNSFDKDEFVAEEIQPTQNALEIADAEDARNEVLNQIAESAAEVSAIAEATVKRYEAGYVPADPAVRSYLGLDDVDDDVIDVDEIDLDFEGGEMTDDDIANLTKASRVLPKGDLTKIFEKITEEEDLNNISEDFLNILDESSLNLDELEDQINRVREIINKRSEENDWINFNNLSAI